MHLFNRSLPLSVVLYATPISTIQWNLSITDTIGESQFVRYREVSLVERFDILMTIITTIVIYIHVVIIIFMQCSLFRLSYSKDTTVSIRESTLVA